MTSTLVNRCSKQIISSAAFSSCCAAHITTTHNVTTTGNAVGQHLIAASTLKQFPRKAVSSLHNNNGLKRYFSTRPVIAPFSLLSASAAATTATTCNSFPRRFTMAATTLILPKKDFSSAALQPRVDALDESVDPVQRQLLEEQCIVLDDNDQVIGHDTKRNCHKIVNGDVLLHRAFSVFLFNGKGELLLQQRSKTKITFPLMWTNTCCSHPLYIPSELEENEAIGVRRAARRRLEIELGIPQDSISLDDFQYLTRIQYKALSNTIWGEHEIDYILFLQKDDLHIEPSADEIQEIRWVTLDKVKGMIGTENVSLTPWFELILNSSLPEWWKNLDNLKQFQDHGKIHRM